MRNPRQDHMKKIIALSHIYPTQVTDFVPYIKKDEMDQTANALFERSFIESLSLNENVEVLCVNRMFTGYKGIINQFEFSEFDGRVKGINVTQTPKRRYLNRSKDLETFWKRNEYLFGNADAVVFFTYHDALQFKKICPRLKKKVAVIPDLPDYVVGNSSFLYSAYRRYLTHKFYKNIKAINYLCPITDTMIVKLKSKTEQMALRFDGVCNEEFSNISANKKNFIFYAGSLEPKYGILELVEAYKKSDISKEYELVIAGRGPASETLKNDDQVNYIGVIDHDECMTMEKEASLLVVPEIGKEKYSKYSFHSKILEYMSSGTPVLLFDYPGLPNDLKPYLNLMAASDNPVSTLAKGLGCLAAKESLEKKAEDALTYLLQTRSKKAVSSKFYDFLFKEE